MRTPRHGVSNGADVGAAKALGPALPVRLKRQHRRCVGLVTAGAMGQREEGAREEGELCWGR